MTSRDKVNLVKDIFGKFKTNIGKILIEVKKIPLLNEVIKDVMKFYMDNFNIR